MADTATVVLSVAGAIAARLHLALTAGDLLASRIELANAFVGIRGIREGLALSALGKSPYIGALHTCLGSLSSLHHPARGVLAAVAQPSP